MNTDTSWSQMDECLVILTEECGEVIQAVSKTMRFPEDDEKNRTRLAKELGDLQCMIDLTCKHLDIDQEDVKATRLKINEYVREIDKCIALLNK